MALEGLGIDTLDLEDIIQIAITASDEILKIYTKDIEVKPLASLSLTLIMIRTGIQDLLERNPRYHMHKRLLSRLYTMVLE